MPFDWFQKYQSLEQTTCMCYTHIHGTWVVTTCPNPSILRKTQSFPSLCLFYFHTKHYLLFKNKLNNLFIYLTGPGLRCDMWGLVPQSGIEPKPSVLEAESFIHLTAREVPKTLSFWHLLPPNVWRFFPTPSSSLPHELGGLQFNLFWHHLPGEGIRAHRLRAQSDKTDPSTSDANPTLKSSPVRPTDWL